MSPDTTKYLIEMVHEMNTKLNQSLHHVKNNETNESFIAYRNVVAEMLELSLVKLLNPLCRQHPNLMPSELFIPESYMKKPDDSGL